jgi:hypothetical protein
MVFDFFVVVDPDNEVTVGCIDFIDLDAIYQVKTSKVNHKRSSLEGFPVLRSLVLSCSRAIMFNARNRGLRRRVIPKLTTAQAINLA